MLTRTRLLLLAGIGVGASAAYWLYRQFMQEGGLFYPPVEPDDATPAAAE